MPNKKTKRRVAIGEATNPNGVTLDQLRFMNPKEFRVWTYLSFKKLIEGMKGLDTKMKGVNFKIKILIVSALIYMLLMIALRFAT